MKKIISILVAVLLVAMLIPAVFAAEAAVFSLYIENPEEKEYWQKGETITVNVYQTGAKISGFKFTDFVYDTAGLKLLGEDTDGDGWIEPCTPGKGVVAIMYGPAGVSGGGTGSLTDRVVFSLQFEIIAENGEFGISFGAAEGDGVTADVSGCIVKVGKPHEHKAAKTVTENEVAATCTKAGSYDEVVYCECGHEMSRNTFTTDALGHDLVLTSEAPEAWNCEVGYDEVYECSRKCGEEGDKDVKHISHAHDMVKYVLESKEEEVDGKIVTYDYVKYACLHGDKDEKSFHGCDHVGDEGWVERSSRPVVGDITPYIAMGTLTLVGLVAAAAYLCLKRKAI